MLPLRLFRKPAFTGVQLAALGVSASMFALFLYITFYLQNHLGHSPLEAGLIYLPFTVINFVVAAAGGALLARVPARVIMSAGLGLTGVGLLLMGGLDPTDEWTALLGGFLVAGAGVGPAQPGDRRRGLSVVPKEQSGMAAGINDTFRQVGIAVGIAAWGAIFLGRGAAKVEELAAGTPAATGERPAPADRGRLVGQPRRGARRPCRRGRAGRCRTPRARASSPGSTRSSCSEEYSLCSPRWRPSGSCASATSSGGADDAEAPVPITDPDGRAVPQPAPRLGRAGWAAHGAIDSSVN